MQKPEVINEVLKTLRKIVRSIDLYSKSIAEKCGLTIPQLMILQELELETTISVGELALKVSLSSATVTDILDRLEKKGYIKRVRDLEDKRKVAVVATESGMSVSQNGPPILQDDFLNHLVDLRDWEKSMILSSLQRVASLMENEEQPPKLVPKILEINTKHQSNFDIIKVTKYDEMPISPEHLARFLRMNIKPYEDSFEDTMQGIDDAIGGKTCKGGFILLSMKTGKLIGGLIILQTYMKGYIPENCLLMIAVDRNLRSRGVGRELIERAIAECDGDIFLHVEYANHKAQNLYERIGFINRYAEMRYYKNHN